MTEPANVDPVEIERRHSIADDAGRRSGENAAAPVPSFSLLFDASPVPTLFEALDGRIVRCNTALAELLGYAGPEAFEGRHASELFAERDAWLQRRRALKEGEAGSGDEVKLRHRDGRDVWALDRAALVAGDDTSGVIRLLVDVTERREEKEGLRTMAFHDALTGLPNRRLLEMRAAQTLALAQRGSHRAGLIFLDMVEFKAINDRLGHPAGDALLRAVGKRLEAARRASDMAARVGGDEFVVMMAGVADPTDARAGAERLVGHLEAPYFIDGRSFRIGARAAVALYPDHGRTFAELMARTDHVLRSLKSTGKGGVRFVEGAPRGPAPGEGESAGR